MREQLLRYLERHDTECWDAGFALAVVAYYTTDDLGYAAAELQFIAPTMRAVRDWLGY